MGAFKVQRGTFKFGEFEDSDTETITAVASLSAAFARITGVRYASPGPDAGTTGNRYVNDMGVRCELTATDTITFTRESSGTDEDVRVYWEVIEGPASGPHAIAVRYHDDVSFADTEGQVDQAVSGISDLANCVPFICGVTAPDTGLRWDECMVTAEMVSSSGDKVRLKRSDTNDTCAVTVAVVEFTGSSWSVENNITHTFSAEASNETESITDVADTSHAFVVSSHRTSNTAARGCNLGHNVWFKDSNELYFRLADNPYEAASNHHVVAHVVRNDAMTVEHLDSITGGETDHPAGSSEPQQILTSITEVDVEATTSLIATADDSDTSGAEYPQAFWGYTLQDADTMRWWRAGYGTTAEWALQVIQWPPAVLELGFTEELEDPHDAELLYTLKLALTEEIEDPYDGELIYVLVLGLTEEVEDPKLALALRTVGDVVASGNAKVLERHKEKTRTLAILDALLDEVQLLANVSDAIREVLRKAFSSGGPLLRVHGGVYNLRRRPEWTDADWIRWMLIKRRALKSAGTVPDIMAVAKLLQPEGSAVPQLEPEFPKAYRITLVDVPADERDLAAEMLEHATAAGVRGTAIFTTTGTDHFAFASPGTTYGFSNGKFADCRAIKGR